MQIIFQDYLHREVLVVFFHNYSQNLSFANSYGRDESSPICIGYLILPANSFHSLFALSPYTFYLIIAKNNVH